MLIYLESLQRSLINSFFLLPSLSRSKSPGSSSTSPTPTPVSCFARKLSYLSYFSFTSACPLYPCPRLCFAPFPGQNPLVTWSHASLLHLSGSYELTVRPPPEPHIPYLFKAYYKFLLLVL
jgi:hypothetical protein